MSESRLRSCYLAPCSIACKQQTHFRSPLLSDRKCVCCSQATCSTVPELFSLFKFYKEHWPEVAGANLGGPVNLHVENTFILLCTFLFIYNIMRKDYTKERKNLQYTLSLKFAKSFDRFLIWSRNLSFSLWSDLTLSPIYQIN